MELLVTRFSSQKNDTLSTLHDMSMGVGKFMCFGLEDERRDVKVMGETRIPEGRYEIKYRKEGGFHNKYVEKYGHFHKGMLHITDIPGFEYVLIHTGNSEKDTAGCYLVGDTLETNIEKDGKILSSGIAYKRIYSYISSELEKGNKVFIRFRNFDTI
jgi:hypothetical protein